MPRKKSPVSADEQELLALIASLDKKFGEGSILRLSDNEHVPVDVISTGCLALDIALGIGGFPRGRISEIYGPEQSGKTALCEHAIREAQRLGLRSAFIDLEHAVDLRHFENLGIDSSMVFVSQPETGEDALETVEALVRSGLFGLVVIDSVAALVPKAEIEGEMGDAVMGKQARLMSQAMRKMRGAVHKSNTAVVFTNQIRQKIGVMFGNPETTTGGLALKFYASVRIDVRRTGPIKDGESVIGQTVKFKVVKNKLDTPFQEAETTLLYGVSEPPGFSFEGDLVSHGVECEVIEKRGAFFSYGETRLGQGVENTRAYLREHPDTANEIKDKILAVLKASRSHMGADASPENEEE